MSGLQTPVEEFTTPNPIVAQESASIEELSKLMRQNGIRHLPITRGSKIVGIVSDRDIRVAQGLMAREDITVLASDVMSENPVTVSAGTPLDEVAFEMSKNKIGSVLVNDENDEFYGIFTITDALNALVELARSSDANI